MLRTIDRLTDNQRTELGIPRGLHVRYKHVSGGLKRIASHLDGGVSIAHHHDEHAAGERETDECPPGCPGGELTEDEIATILVQASLPPTFSPPSAVALDGTDVESFYAPYFSGARESDGRVCACPDARWGKRTATDRRPTEWYVGFEAHLATYILGAGAHGELPLLCAGLALRPGVKDRAGAALGMVRSLTAFGPVHEVLYDRGYSTAKAEHLAHPLHELGISVTFDLHATQCGPRPGPVPGTIWVDGSLFSTALPEPLRRLDPPDVGDTPEQRGRIRDCSPPGRRTPSSRIPSQ